MMGGIIGAIAGIITGFILASLSARKSLDDAWNTAYALGFREGVETERIAQANMMKENVLFAKDAEEVNGDVQGD